MLYNSKVSKDKSPVLELKIKQLALYLYNYLHYET